MWADGSHDSTLRRIGQSDMCCPEKRVGVTIIVRSRRAPRSIRSRPASALPPTGDECCWGGHGSLARYWAFVVQEIT